MFLDIEIHQLVITDEEQKFISNNHYILIFTICSNLIVIGVETIIPQHDIYKNIMQKFAILFKN